MAWIGIRKELADVGQGEGAQDGIGHGVVEGIAIRMSHGTGFVLNADPAQHKGAARPRWGDRLKPMQIVTMAHTEVYGWARAGIARSVCGHAA